MYLRIISIKVFKLIINTQTEQLDEVRNTIETPASNLEANKSLEELIRENSWFLCEICDFKSKSKKGLITHTVIYFRKMFVVCQKSKYGFCLYGKRCDRIHFTDICALNQECRDKFCCDKRHLYIWYYFDKFGRCKFGNHCEYMHMESAETKFQKEIEILKKEILHLKTKNEELERKITNVSANHFHKSVQTDDIVRSSKNTQTEQLEEVKNTIETPASNLEANKSLGEIIRENSWFLCEICDFKSKSIKGLRIYMVKSHSVVSIENNFKVLVYYGGGLREDDKINYIKCNLCGFQKEDSGFTDRSLLDKHFKKWKNML